MRVFRICLVSATLVFSAASANTTAPYEAFTCADMDRALMVQDAYFEGRAAEVAREVCQTTSTPNAAAAEWLKQHASGGALEFGVHHTSQPTVFIKK